MNINITPLPNTQHPIRTVLHVCQKNSFLLILLLGLVVLSIIVPSRIASYPNLVDWPTIAAMTGLLIFTKGLEISGATHRIGHWLVGLIATERSAALCLVMAAALLSTVLTNDVALFVVGPLTLCICRLAKMSATRFIIFEALAVNTGSALTPIGNPQNLFLWEFSKVSFGEFVIHMFPLVAFMMIVLLVLTICMFDNRPIQVSHNAERLPLDRTLFGMSLGLYLPFLIAIDMHYPGWAVFVVLLIFLLLRRRVVARIDWGLLLLFVLMFVDLRLLVNLSLIRDGMRSLGLEQMNHLYLMGIGASQIISNVPTAIALAEYSTNWQVIAYSVTVGGFL
jgi:di/tricarboxylate transporter